MAGVQVNPETVIQHLAQQVGQKSAELAMTSAALEAANARIAELEKPAEGDAELADTRANLERARAEAVMPGGH